MTYLWLYLGLLAAWVLISLAGASQLAVRAIRNGEVAWGSVSLLPGVLLMPILFLGIAYLVNILSEQAGFWLVGALHVFLGTGALGYLVYSLIYVKRNSMKP